MSKKIAPLSVTRNYARRILREVFRRHSDEFAGLDLVVRLQKPFPPKARSIIEAELLGQLSALREKVARGGRVKSADVKSVDVKSADVKPTDMKAN